MWWLWIAIPGGVVTLAVLVSSVWQTIALRCGPAEYGWKPRQPKVKHPPRSPEDAEKATPLHLSYPYMREKRKGHPPVRGWPFSRL
jgi:hypothetical protein